MLDKTEIEEVMERSPMKEIAHSWDDPNKNCSPLGPLGGARPIFPMGTSTGQPRTNGDDS